MNKLFSYAIGSLFGLLILNGLRPKKRNLKKQDYTVTIEKVDPWEHMPTPQEFMRMLRDVEKSTAIPQPQAIYMSSKLAEELQNDIIDIPNIEYNVHFDIASLAQRCGKTSFVTDQILNYLKSNS